ncbi:MAG TPA: hypothetical protein VFO41_13955, partial [Alphaproteobacteria bacterium]|nr:hypothetical protein [Alphaproteobacteria bacterium]
PAQVASTDAAPATAVPGESDPSQAMQVASTQADEVPPIPMPRSMRPQSVDLASAPAPQDGQPLILDENQVRRDQAALDREAVRPPVEDPRPSPADQRSVAADQRPGEFFGPPDASEDRMIGEDQLEAWNSGSLSDYLRRNGLLDDSAAPPTEPEIDDSYDPDGFYLSDGPNRSRRDDYYRRRYLDSWYF